MRRHLLLVVGGLALVFLVLSVPGSLREAAQRGTFYVFTAEFWTDLPKRLAGPGRFRFVFQPAVAILLGWKSGRDDARAGRPAMLRGLLRREHRDHFLRDTLGTIAVLLLMGVLLDSVFQWVLLGVSYPGAALIVGPVLITVPYVLARSVANVARPEQVH